MHLHVVSKSISPAIVLNIRSPELPDHTPCPPAWADQAEIVAAEDLVMPENIHAFDKATWAITLLNIVEFDLSRHGSVSCMYLDGSADKWFLPERAINMLMDVVDAVSESYVIAEREKKVAASTSKKSPVMQKISKSAGRSIKELMSALITPSSKEAKSVPEVRPVDSKSGQLATLDVAQSRHLRRWARSTLVDIFRRFVLPELRVRPSIMAGAIIHTGYVKWIAEAMLDRTHARLNRMLDAAVKDQFGTLTESKGACRRPSVPWIEDSEDDDDTLSSGTTVSDGASIATPAEGRSPSRGHISPLVDAKNVPRDLRPTEVLSPAELSIYEDLAHRCRRWGDLLSHIAMRENKYQLDLRHHYAVLEFRARRKAWSNCALKGRAGSSPRDLLNSKPLTRSRLATCEPITAWPAGESGTEEDDACAISFDGEFTKSLVSTSPMSFASSEDDLDVPSADTYLLPPPVLPRRPRPPMESSLGRGLQELHISKRLASAEHFVEQRRGSFHIPRPLHPPPRGGPPPSGPEDRNPRQALPTSIHSSEKNNSIPQTLEPAIVSGSDDDWAYADAPNGYVY